VENLFFLIPYAVVSVTPYPTTIYDNHLHPKQVKEWLSRRKKALGVFSGYHPGPLNRLQGFYGA